jgi:rubrerythrin
MKNHRDEQYTSSLMDNQEETANADGVTDCFWCNEVYDKSNYKSCPNCATVDNVK